MREGDQTVRCAHCAEVVRKVNLEEHVRTDLNYFPMHCYLCNQKFPSEKILREHFGLHHVGIKVKICVIEEDRKLVEACKEIVRKSFDKMDVTTQGSTERNIGESTVETSSHYSRNEDEDKEGSSVKCLKMSSLQKRIPALPVEDELPEQVLKKEFFNVEVPGTTETTEPKKGQVLDNTNQSFPHFQESANEGNENVRAAGIGRSKSDGEGFAVRNPSIKSKEDGTVGTSKTKDDVRLVAFEKESFYAAVSRVVYTDEKKKREASCALCEWKWTVPTHSNWKAYIIRHVSKHLGKRPFNCTTCQKPNIGWIKDHYRKYHRGTKPPPCDQSFTPGIAEEMMDTLLKCFPHLKACAKKGEVGKKLLMDTGDSRVDDTGKLSLTSAVGYRNDPNSSPSSVIQQKVPAIEAHDVLFKEKNNKYDQEREDLKSPSKRVKKEVDESGRNTSVILRKNKPSSSDCIYISDSD